MQSACHDEGVAEEHVISIDALAANEMMPCGFWRSIVWEA